MKLTISNKTAQEKPINKGKFFGKEGTDNRIKFKTGNFDLDTIEQIIRNGYVISYLFLNDDAMTRNEYTYKGTQFICVDIDSCEIEPSKFIDSIKYKPTIAYTTYSNLTEVKGFKWCFHLLYFFDEILYSEEQFYKYLSLLTEDYKDFVDNNAKDCHRIIFGSNDKLENFKLIRTNKVYSESDFDEVEKFDNIDTLFNQNSDCLKNDFLNKSTTNKNLSRNPKNRQVGNNDTKTKSNHFNLDKEFFHDLNSLDRVAFIDKYSYTYPYITNTYISEDMFVNGYADVRNINYYVVPTAQYKWNSKLNKPVIEKVKNGHRNTLLWLDAIAFMKIIPNITKEYLVYLLVTEVFKNFINGDGQLNNWFIINKAKDVWENIEHLDLKPIKKSFVIDKGYWLKLGYNNWLEVARIIRKEIKENDFGSLYDFNLTIEENIEEMKKYGVSTTKKTLTKWLDQNKLDYVTNKDFRNSMIIYYYKENPKRSSREIVKLCANDGIKVGKDTVIKVLNEFRVLSEN